MSKIAKLNVDELEHFRHAPYTIIDRSGKLICQQGDEITPRLLTILRKLDCYTIKKDDVSVEEKDNIFEPSTINKILNITQEFLDTTAKGQKGSIAAIQEGCNMLVEEIILNFDNIKYVEDVRVKMGDYALTHGINVASLSVALALKVGLDKRLIKHLTMAAMLHDLGKVKIPKQIIDKPEKLTPKEYEIAKLHAPLGYKLLKEEYQLPNFILLGVLDHHERYDGSGYNRGLDEDQISFVGQIIALADVYDAITSTKPYAKNKTPKTALRELLGMSRQFNPKVLYPLVHMLNFNSGEIKKTSIKTEVESLKHVKGEGETEETATEKNPAAKNV